MSEAKGFFSDWAPQTDQKSLLDTYLSGLKNKFLNSDPEYTISHWENYQSHLDRHFHRLTSFLSEPGNFIQNLVLGNVQAGKTGHLMSSIAWARDNDFHLVVLLNGNKNTLSIQTSKRVQKDLGGKIKLISVQTQLAKSHDEFSQELVSAIKARRSRDDAPLPAAVLIKNAARLDGLTETLKALAAEGPSKEIRVLVLDDEADQASPDTNTSKKLLKPPSNKSVHEALKRLSAAVHGKVVYLSYTATPQAMFHQDRDSFMTPRYCSVVPSGPSYFGLSDLLATPGALAPVDLLAQEHKGETAEERELRVLESAFIEFLVNSWLHSKHCAKFHDGAPCDMKSVQMLIHPSGLQQSHRDFAKLVTGLRSDLVELLKEGDGKAFFLDEIFTPVYLDRLNKLGLLDEAKLFASDCMDHVFDLLGDESKLRLKIVNTDARQRLASTGDQVEFLPSEDKEWDEAPAWILVGGDILGRGLTIPHLVTTFFLRNPKVPTFDNSVQQMRFCGYRKSYRSLVRVFAPTDVIDEYRNYLDSDQFLRQMADEWDAIDRDLRENPPTVIHLTPKGSRSKAVRSSVTSIWVQRKSASKDGFIKLDSLQSRSEFKVSIDALKSLIGGDLKGSEPFSRVVELTKVIKFLSLPVFKGVAENNILTLEAMSENSAFFERPNQEIEVYFDWQASDLKVEDLSDSLAKVLGQKLSKKDGSFGYRGIAEISGVKTSSDWLDDKPVHGNLKALVGQRERGIRATRLDQPLLVVKPFIAALDGDEPLSISLTAIFWLPEQAPDLIVHFGSIDE